jgi:hypothetical protein
MTNTFLLQENINFAIKGTWGSCRAVGIYTGTDILSFFHPYNINVIFNMNIRTLTIIFYMTVIVYYIILWHKLTNTFYLLQVENTDSALLGKFRFYS